MRGFFFEHKAKHSTKQKHSNSPFFKKIRVHSSNSMDLLVLDATCGPFSGPPNKVTCSFWTPSLLFGTSSVVCCMLPAQERTKEQHQAAVSACTLGGRRVCLFLSVVIVRVLVPVSVCCVCSCILPLFVKEASSSRFQRSKGEGSRVR